MEVVVVVTITNSDFSRIVSESIQSRFRVVPDRLRVEKEYFEVLIEYNKENILDGNGIRYPIPLNRSAIRLSSFTLIIVPHSSFRSLSKKY